MGLFDSISVSHPAFVCSEGHDLSDEQFQSKDFGCTMGLVDISDVTTFEPGDYGGPPSPRPLNGTFDIYCECSRCPCFVQANTYNHCPTSCSFDVVIKDDRVVSVTRTSPSTAEYLETEPKKPYMKGCLGPMLSDEAQCVRLEYWRARYKNES